MKIINWELEQDFINNLFLSFVENREIVCLWQSGDSSIVRSIFSGELTEYAIEKKLVEFLLYEEADFIKTSNGLYFYSQSSDVIFKTSILKKQQNVIVAKLPQKIILLSEDLSSERVENFQDNSDLLRFISDIKENLQKMNIAKGKQLKESAKKFQLGKDPVPRQKNWQNLFIKLEDLVEDPLLVLENIQKVGIVLNGYGPFDLEVKSFSSNEATIVAQTKTLFKDSDEIEVVSLDGVLVKDKFKGIVKEVNPSGRKFMVKVEFQKNDKD